LKALVSTGSRNVQAACDWLFSHVDDPFLDDPLPREYVLYLRPTGPLLHQLTQYWQQSRLTCGKNKAHNIFPHITLCQFFMLYTSSNFIGLFVEEQVAEVLKCFAADFATEAAAKADVHIEPHKKQLHVTLAYHFQANHLPVLEKLSKSMDVSVGCDWLAVMFSRDIRFANHEVMYPYAPQNEDELELAPGDFVFMSAAEQASASEGWVYGSSLGTGLSGLLPENYVTRADECETWVVHGLGDLAGLGVLSPPMQLLRSAGEQQQSRAPKRRLFVCRHGERMDVVFGKHWATQCFDAKGRYVRCNLNMPSSLPIRSGGFRDYEKDCPITVFGGTQARLVGEALLESHTAVDFVYCSPSLRCVQTALNIVQGLQLEGKARIRVEPGLFEWTKWVAGTCLPAWIPPAELAAAGLSVDTTYRKLAVSESYDTYISRSFQVTREILTECQNLGLQLEGKARIRVEPGLFEWTKWVAGTCLPAWIPPAELAAAGLSVDTTYRWVLVLNPSALCESYDTYISRSFQVTREILTECQNLASLQLEEREGGREEGGREEGEKGGQTRGRRREEEEEEEEDE
ncbi:hypothetical protein CRUP_021438, partial [Coryphaenoides rupestris]